MATSSINDQVVIKDDATFDRLLEILNKPSRFDDIKPITPEEEQQGREAFERCLLRHFKKQ
jgi:SpoVK/Ycf46/Vps4 family AAA+-type ATPase